MRQPQEQYTDAKSGKKLTKIQSKRDIYDDEDFEEPPDQRALPHFLQNLPGVTATDSMGYRIEALRVYLERQLGDVPFIAAYKHLIVSSGSVTCAVEFARRRRLN